MKSLPTLLIILCALAFSGQAQYSPYPPDSVSEKTYTRVQIRQFLLEIDDMEVSGLAKSSRRQNTAAVVFYSLGAIYIAGGIAALVEMGNGNDTYGILPYGAGIGIGAGALGITLGTWQLRKSQLNLNQALNLYYQKSVNTTINP